MASNFQIIPYNFDNILFLRLTGDFDEDSAQELTNTLIMHSAGCWDIFIDTNDLKIIHPFGKITLQMNLSNFQKQLNNLFFIGANKNKIAPN